MAIFSGQMIEEQKKASTSQAEVIAKQKEELIARDDAINRLGK